MSGDGDKFTGRVKEAAGDLTDDNELKAKGKKQQVAGDIKNAGDKIGDKVGELGDKVKN